MGEEVPRRSGTGEVCHYRKAVGLADTGTQQLLGIGRTGKGCASPQCHPAPTQRWLDWLWGQGREGAQARD